MAEQFSLDLLGQHILAMRGDVATIKTDVAAIKDRLDHHQDELSVVSGLAMRATARNQKPVAGIEADALERRDR